MRKVEALNQALRVHWDPPCTITLSTCITGYQVQYSSDLSLDDPWISWAHPDTSLKTKISPLEAGTKYWVRVRAIIKGFPGQWSNIIATVVSSTFGVPDAPESVTLTPGNQQLTVSWQAPTDNGGSEIVGYQIAYTNDDGDFTRGSRCNPGEPATCITDTSTVLTDLTNGVSYEVSLGACNLAGCSIFGPAVSGTPSQ